MNKARVFNRLAVVAIFAARGLSAQTPASPTNTVVTARPPVPANAQVPPSMKLAGELDRLREHFHARHPDVLAKLAQYNQAQAAETLERGRNLVLELGVCQECHTPKTETRLLMYLQTGLAPKGTPAGPSMPAYKLPRADAEAIVADLKTLP